MSRGFSSSGRRTASLQVPSPSFYNYPHDMKTWKIAGINFDHMHMGDLLRLVHEHPEAEIVGICHEDPARMEGTAQKFAIPGERQFADYRECLEQTKPDIAILCPSTARHGEYVQKVAPYGVH